MRGSTVTVLMACAGLMACSQVTSFKESEQAVADFRAFYSAEDYDAIYDAASDKFRSKVTKADFKKYMGGVQRQLGDFESSSRIGIHARTNDSGNFLTLNYASNYTNGNAGERFVYRITAKGPELFGYTINSTVFVTG